MQGSNSPSAAGNTSAFQFSQVAILLLAIVPMNSILKVSDTVMADVEDDEEDQPEASTSYSSSGTTITSSSGAVG